MNVLTSFEILLQQNGSLECGQCYEVTGPFGTVTAIVRTLKLTLPQSIKVMRISFDDCSSRQVGDYCPVQGNEQWCSGDMVHFDLRDSTFSQIAQSSWGVIEMNYRKVPLLPFSLSIFLSLSLSLSLIFSFFLNLHSQ